MKITKENYSELKTAIRKAIEYLQIIHQIPDIKSYYKESMKVTDERFRWDMMWAAKDNGFMDYNLIKDYNDSHIDTALIKIIKELY